MHLGTTEEPSKGCISCISCLKFPNIYSEYKNYALRQPHCCLTPPPWGTPANICIYLIFLENRINDLHFAADSGYVFVQTILSSRVFWPFNVIIGTNRKSVWDFLLVRHSNLGPILHRFRDIAGFVLITLFQPNFGRVHVGSDRPRWGQPYLKTHSCPWSLFRDTYFDGKSWNSLGTNGLNNCQYILYIQYVTHYN